MSLDLFRWLLAGVFLLELVIGIYLGNGVSFGVSAEWANEAYKFEAGSSVWALGLCVFNVALYVLLLKATQASAGKPVPGVFRRWIAFWVDFLWLMSSLPPIMGLLPVFLEAQRTGHFAWSFARDTRMATDIPSAILAGLLASAVSLFYFSLPVLCSRPSPGACLLGYEILREEGMTLTLGQAIKRTLLGSLAVCCAPLAPFVNGERLLKARLDERFGVRAVTLR